MIIETSPGEKSMTPYEKKNNQLDYSFLVDQTLRISNLSFIEGLLQIQDFIDRLYL
jgi:hypothetical protein